MSILAAWRLVRPENNMEKILMGKIVNVVGLKGEVKVYSYTDRNERFEELESIWLENKVYNIENVRYQNKVVILKLEGINDRNQAEAQRNKKVYIEETDLQELPEDTYYVRDLIGMEVVTESGKLGTISDVIQNSAQDLYEVKTEEGKKVYIPVVKQFVIDVDMDSRIVKVELPEGLLDL
ncbi:MAG: 16S rRNA processing protein RimM [Firmicutes bacterium]|nr:16S rRNA processing protein RimM [Bacillota bacterium]